MSHSRAKLNPLGRELLISRIGAGWSMRAAARASYVWWKYERLGPLAGGPPAERDGRLSFTTIAHPLFDDLSTLSRKRLVELIAPLGLAVWMTDLGRLELRADAFLPAQRHVALAAV